ncbi:MAG: thioredoxin family protein [Pyramidobacter sp.]|jgi:small redox-active disulfide protein 2
MKTIQVLGTGCSRCHQTETAVKEAVAKMGLQVAVEFVSDLKQIMAMGVMGLPAVAVDGKVVLAGQVPTADQMVRLLSRFASSTPAVPTDR